jgi:hypothetical protein
MRKVLGWICVGVWLALGMSATGAWAAKKKSAKKATSKSTAGKKATPTKKGASGAKNSASAAKKETASKSATKKGKKGASSRTTWRNRQTTPTPERYKEIQEALAAKGFLKPEDATGSWGAGSVDALKRFQAQQNIDATGKINSLSLIALGLGPKREPYAAIKPPETPAAAPEK